MIYESNKDLVRRALSSDKHDRDQLTRDNPNLPGLVSDFWNGGSICGQCENFNPVGGHKGLNGTCRSITAHQYIKPESIACNNFKKRYNDEKY